MVISNPLGEEKIGVKLISYYSRQVVINERKVQIKNRGGSCQFQEQSKAVG